jgi:hypothetical protein
MVASDSFFSELLLVATLEWILWLWNGMVDGKLFI